MKINWKLRLQNKITLTSIVLMGIAIVYEVLSICGIIPKVPQDSIVYLAKLCIEFLSLLGIVVDPTTPGMEDSDRAMSYEVLGGDSGGEDSKEE